MGQWQKFTNAIRERFHFSVYGDVARDQLPSVDVAPDEERVIQGAYESAGEGAPSEDAVNKAGNAVMSLNASFAELMNLFEQGVDDNGVDQHWFTSFQQELDAAEGLLSDVAAGGVCLQRDMDGYRKNLDQYHNFLRSLEITVASNDSDNVCDSVVDDSNSEASSSVVLTIPNRSCAL